jgi:chromate transporter
MRAGTRAILARLSPKRLSMSIPFRDAIAVWAKIGLLSFGGPAAQIALMHHELVEKRRWISEARFLNALNFCMLLPGPEAQQLSIYLGWLLHRNKGGLVAGLLFILPGFFCMLVLSFVYVRFGQTAFISALFFGLKAAILAIVAQAIFRIAKKTLSTIFMMLIAASSFVALYFFDMPFPIIIALAGITGFLGQGFFPHIFFKHNENENTRSVSYVIDEQIDQQQLVHAKPSIIGSIKTALLWLAIWALPVIAVVYTFGGNSVLAKQATFFSQTALFSFGGAYAVLAYVAQRTVEEYQWLSPREMVDGLALAETTPGPLIMVLQFVAFVSAYRYQTDMSPISAGILASCLTAWVSFAPCFLWIFVGAPYIEKLRRHLRLQSALKTITAAVVGVIANLSLWFALHALFTDTVAFQWHGFSYELPDWTSVQWRLVAITVIALIASFKFKMSAIKLMAMCIVLGFLAQLY